MNYQGLFEFFLDFSREYEHFLNQNVKAEKVHTPPCMVIKWNSPIQIGSGTKTNKMYFNKFNYNILIHDFDNFCAWSPN